MASLPTLDMTQDNIDRIISAFGTEEVFLGWLRDTIVNQVAAKEAEAIYEAAATAAFDNKENFRTEIS